MIMYVFAVMILAGAWLLFRLWRTSLKDRGRNTRRGARSSAPARRIRAGKVNAKSARGKQAPAKRKHPSQIASKPQAAPQKAIAESSRSRQPPTARAVGSATESLIVMTRVRPSATSTAGIVRALNGTSDIDTRRTAPTSTAAPSSIRTEPTTIVPATLRMPAPVAAPSPIRAPAPTVEPVAPAPVFSELSASNRWRLLSNSY
jgi:hypothetical protein